MTNDTKPATTAAQPFNPSHTVTVMVGDTKPELPGGEWQTLFWTLAKELNCLPSTYVDANEHVLRAAQRAQAALTQARAGWRLVPVEPTEEMGLAYLAAARLHAADGAENTMRFSWGGYRAMLNAAPSPADQPHHLTIAEQRTLGRALHKSVRFVDGTDQPSDWRPIESAPRDGTDILLSNGRVVAEGHWLHAEPYVRENRDLEGRYVGQDESDGHDGWIDWSGGMQPEPTTWMPLPPPPAEKP